MWERKHNDEIAGRSKEFKENSKREKKEESIK